MEKETLKMRGTVKWFDTQKGYGFIIDSESKKDVFVHHSNIIMDGFRHLNEDDIVNFELGAGKDGREQAVDVKPMLTIKMVEDSLKEENLYVKEIKSNKNTIVMNALNMNKGYMVVDGNNVLQTDENGMSFIELAAYANFEIVEKSA